jgi:hypothetical protein
MEINTLDMEPLAVRDPVAPDAYDFASVATHEAGHFLGIAHSDVPGATMYARYDQGQTSMRYVSPDDVEGICTVYRPDGDRAVLNGKITQAPGCNPTPRGGYDVQCQKREASCGSASTSLAGAAIVVGLRRRRLRGLVR